MPPATTQGGPCRRRRHRFNVDGEHLRRAARSFGVKKSSGVTRGLRGPHGSTSKSIVRGLCSEMYFVTHLWIDPEPPPGSLKFGVRHPKISVPWPTPAASQATRPDPHLRCGDVDRRPLVGGQGPMDAVITLPNGDIMVPILVTMMFGVRPPAPTVLRQCCR